MTDTILYFQTGRHYGPEGQHITATIVETAQCPILDIPRHSVAFIDHTRGIQGIVGVYDFTPAAILAAYDQGGYTHLSSDSDAYRELSA